MVPEHSTEQRVTVQVSVPEWQKAEWEAHSDELDMSLSEFFRSMVQAGRNGYAPEPTHESPDQNHTDIQDELLTEISEVGPVSWDELITAFTTDIETRVNDALEELQSAGKVMYSGPKNGYVVPDEQ